MKSSHRQRVTDYSIGRAFLRGGAALAAAMTGLFGEGGDAYRPAVEQGTRHARAAVPAHLPGTRRRWCARLATRTASAHAAWAPATPPAAGNDDAEWLALHDLACRQCDIDPEKHRLAIHGL